MRLAFLAMTTATLFAVAPAIAQQTTGSAAGSTEGRSAQDLADCMLANVTAVHEQQMKTVVIDALQDDTDALNRSVMVMGVSILTLAQQHCGLTAKEIQSPMFEEAAGIVGGVVGERLITRALSKIGM